MEERLYLILDSKGTPLANAVLESPQKAEVLQIRVLGGKEEVVAAHQELQLIGMDDTSPDRVVTAFTASEALVSFCWYSS